MSNHSIIEHRANYYFVKLEEDYLAICANGTTSTYCKGLILSILEHWTNDKIDKGSTEDETYIYMTYPQWVSSMYGFYRRSIVIECLTELTVKGLIHRKPVHRRGHDTYEYALNIQEIQQQIRNLPAKEKSAFPDLSSFKFKRLKSDDLISNDLKVNPETSATVQNQTVRPFKSKRNIESSLDSFSLDSKKQETISEEETTNQPSLLDTPLVEPSMNGKWDSELVVQYTEYRNGRRYPPQMRESQLAAAKWLYSKDKNLTSEIYKRAFDKRFDAWWLERKNKLDVTDMKTKEPSSGIVRLYAQLDKLEAEKSKPNTPRTAPTEQFPNNRISRAPSNFRNKTPMMEEVSR